MYKLIIEDDEGKTTVVPLIRDEISIGRKEGNTIRLTERNVSRRHARLMRQNGAVYIEDLTSYNGIKVNGDRITGRAAIGEGDRIQIGDYQLSVKLDRTDPKSVPAAAPARGEDGPTTPFVKPQEPAMQAASAATVPVQQAVSPPPQSAAPTIPHPVLTMPLQPPQQAAPGKPARLVVVSKNFAGQEFPLDKAAVVIGRTEENDVVINHRSISRHHAKIVREGGHYHIVDLQSANGVRVNGEEYGKVELRKGDKIDLGHVRLIFLSPGQEFDIKGKVEETEPGGRRSMGMLALVMLLVFGLGGGLYYYFTTVKPPRPVDADGESAKILADLDGDLLNRRWDDAISKADSVLHSEASSNRKDVAASKKDKAETEKKNQAYYDRLIEAGGGGNYDEALHHYHEIPAESIYRQLAKEQYDKIFPLFADTHLEKAETAKGEGRCPDFKSEVQKVLTEDANHLKARKLNGESCGLAIREPTTGPGRTHTPKKNDGKQTGNPVLTPGENATKPPPDETEGSSPLPDDEANKILEQAQTEYVNGNFESAIKLAHQLQKGHGGGASGASSRAWRIIGAAACNLRDLKLTGDAYRKLDASARQYVKYVCQRAGVVFDAGTPKLAE